MVFECPHVQRGLAINTCTLYNDPLREHGSGYLQDCLDCHGKHLLITVVEGKTQ